MSFTNFGFGYTTLLSQSFAASSSIGPVQLWFMQAAMEYQYHFVNSQQLANVNNDTIKQIWQEGDFASSAPKLSKKLGTYGPFRLNLDKNGQPQPLAIYFNGWIQDNFNNFQVTGTFTFSLRGYNEFGQLFNSQILTKTTSSLTYSTGTAYKQPWSSLTTSAAPYGYSITDSLVLPMLHQKNAYLWKTRSTQSITTNDVSARTYLGYIDVSFGINSYTIQSNSNPMYATVKGFYAREVCGFQPS